jgi:exopolysaccharide biosynthesis polyprenyl glycosylphosphotransferase
MKKGELIFSVLLVPVDFLMLLLAGIGTYLVRTRILDAFRPVEFAFNLPFERFFVIVLITSLFFIAAYAISGLYSVRSTRTVLEDFSRISVASSAGIMAVIIYMFLRAELFDSRFLVLGAWVAAIFTVALGRFTMRQVQKQLLARRGFGVHKVLVIGTDEVSRRMVDKMRNDPSKGYRVIKQLSDPRLIEVRDAVGNPGIDEVIMADPNYPRERVQEIVDFCHENHLIFRFVPNIHNTLTSNFSIDTFTGIPLVELKRTRLDGWGRVAKRTLDILGSALGLIILSLLFGAVAFAIKWETEGPVFVHLDRISKNRKFKLHKFRSMIKDAEKYKQQLIDMGFNERGQGPMFKMKNDPRLTKVGKFIRRTRIDELPQLYNVLKSEISLVGPRPHQPDEVEKYQRHHKKVLAIKAGVTGMAQISGSSDLPFDEEVALDTIYIENWSFYQDIKILIFTVFKAFRDKSAA